MLAIFEKTIAKVLRTTSDQGMKHLFTSCAILLGLISQGNAQDAPTAEPLRQAPPAAYLSMTNLDGAFDFDETDWRAAVARAGARIYWKIDRDSAYADRVMEVAASAEGAPPFASLYTANLPPDQVGAFDQLLDGLLRGDSETEFANAESLMVEPLCRLLRLREQAGEVLRTHYIVTIDRSEERRACYSTTIAHVLANAEAFVPPPLERIALDSMAAVTQAMMPPLIVKSEDFIEADTWRNDRRAVPRDDDSVFAPGEMIMLNALLENVGRDMVGTPLATYEIRLDIEIRDAAGNVVADQQDAMRFSGSAIHSVPIRKDYFETGVVTGFQIDQPGEYRIRYRLSDLNRPEEVAVVEIVKQVIIR